MDRFGWLWRRLRLTAKRIKGNQMAGVGLISVVLSTYNAPEFLSVALSSLQHQTDRNFEVVVADDGSDGRTRDVVAAAARVLPVRHAWHEDRGFRLSRIRNLAIRQSSGDYLIFVDGDCFVLGDFIALHRVLAEAGKFVSGKRSYLRAGITRQIVAVGRAPIWGRAQWLARSLLNQATRPAEFLRRGDGAWRNRKARDWQRAQACNLGVFRSDVDAVNGFDNRYAAHGLEDSDFILRLIHAGIARKLGDFAVPVLHLEHPRRGDGGPSPNTPMFEELLRSGARRATDGLAQTA